MALGKEDGSDDPGARIPASCDRPVTGRGALLGFPFVILLATAAAAEPDPATKLSEVVVTADRRELIGNASTASEGVVVNDELALMPAYRPGQLLETVPGLQ